MSSRDSTFLTTYHQNDGNCFDFTTLDEHLFGGKEAKNWSLDLMFCCVVCNIFLCSFASHSASTLDSLRNVVRCLLCRSSVPHINAEERRL